MVAPARGRGRFVVEKSSVRVLAPEHFRGHHDAAIGNFGVPDYGGTLTGAVLQPDKKATGYAEFPARFKSKSGRPVVLLLDRGVLLHAQVVERAAGGGGGGADHGAP
ncbi:vacuolar-sorting receptor 7-like [Triticum dicoccoides]|uniref:vacuolar-sorting receptor 7-like n=1 Tax=Triticum dicoccoides TaxID=85692 RepID=UPI001891BFB0|nr:vacuolar-sorting receptor 7-like [Triticum dicoccoides]